MRNPDDFQIDKGFQPVSEYTDRSFDINCFMLSSLFYKGSALLSLIFVIIEYWWNSVHPSELLPMCIITFFLWRMSNGALKHSVGFNGTLNSLRYDIGRKMTRYILTTGVVSMTIIVAVSFFPMESFSIIFEHSIPSWYITIACIFFWAAEYFECCTPLPPSVKQARQAFKLAAQTT